MLANMFEGMDRAVIQSVFQSNNFNMERTVDNLLTLNSIDTAPSVPKKREESIPVSSSLAEARALHAQRQAAEKQQEFSRGREKKKWRNPLPDDFLR